MRQYLFPSPDEEAFDPTLFQATVLEASRGVEGSRLIVGLIAGWEESIYGGKRLLGDGICSEQRWSRYPGQRDPASPPMRMRGRRSVGIGLPAESK